MTLAAYALAAAIDELERLGVPTTRQTILVAGGLNRRAGHRELEALLATVVRAPASTVGSRCTTSSHPTSSTSATRDGHPCA